MPIIPEPGTKGNPSAVPPAIRQKAQLRSAVTLAVFNGTTRRTLLMISSGGSWGKARYCTQADHTIPPSLKDANQYKAAQS